MLCFESKMHQIRFRLRLCPRPRWGSLQRSPTPPPAGFKRPTSKGREERGGRTGGAGKGGGKEGKGPTYKEMRRGGGRGVEG